MAKARAHSPIDFDGATNPLFPELSKHTHNKQRALKTLLAVLHDCNVLYWWVSPFHLQIQWEGRSVIIRHPRFQKCSGLPLITYTIHSQLVSYV